MRAETCFNNVFVEGYRPLDHLIAESDSIAAIPHKPRHLLRWWPNAGATHTHAVHNNPDSAGFINKHVSLSRTALEDTVANLEDELRYLHSLEARVPIPGRDTVSIIADADIVAMDGLAIFTVVRKFAGQPLNASDQRGLSQVASYAEYLVDRCDSNKPYLYDIFKPGQHIIGHKDTQPILTDIEPLMAAAFETLIHFDGSTEPIIEKSMRNINVWAEHLFFDESARIS